MSLTIEAWNPVLSLILVALALMGSPGPSTLSATAVGAAFGFRRSLPYVGGLVLGTSFVLAAVAAGVTTALLAMPHAASVLGVAAALYILHLAWRIATAPPLQEGISPAAAPVFASGFLLAVANPKAWLAFAALQAGTALVPEAPVVDAVAKCAILATMVVLVHLAWLLGGASLSRLLREPRASRRVNRLLAAALVAATGMALLGGAAR